jgi:hypothetical protein
MAQKVSKFTRTGMTYDQAMRWLRRPHSRLVLQHSRSPTNRAYFIMPGGIYVDRETVQAIIKHHDVRPYEQALLPDCPQPWRLCA